MDKKTNVEKIIKEWYKDGFATWSYHGANDGEDGMFGGSFHHIEIQILKTKPLYVEVYIDYGSVDEEQAKLDLNRRLIPIGCGVDFEKSYDRMLYVTEF
jgi:hypothetical protein